MSGSTTVTVPIPLITDSISGSGEVRASERVEIDPGMLDNLVDARFEVSFDASSLTADADCALVDPSGPTDLDTVTMGSGTTSERTRSGSDVSGSLPSDGEVKAEVNGDGTNSATLRSARLVLHYELAQGVV